MSKFEDRDIRQRDIVPRDKLQELNVAVVGVGAIGRQVALQLAAIGAKSITLIDDDTVGVENLAAQGFLEADLGSLKVEAVKDMINKINSECEVEIKDIRYDPQDTPPDVLFCCVDSMDAREYIFRSVQGISAFFVDTRMSSNVVRIISVYDDKTEDHYANTIYGAEEVFQGSCTAKSTIFTANIAAGLALGAFTQWLREMQPVSDFTYNLLSADVHVEDK